MALWVWLAIGAAVTQAIRSAFQKSLVADLGNIGASLVRFSYAIPFAWSMVLGYSWLSGQSMPTVTLGFLGWLSIAGLFQIIFTILLVTMFSHRSFAVGAAFSKTEVIQAALFEAMIIGYIVGAQVGLAIILGVVAVFFLSVAKSQLSMGNVVQSLFTKQAAIGIASGAALGFCTVAFRAAIDALEDGDLLVRAGLAGAVAVVIQTAALSGWMWVRVRPELIASFVQWRRAWKVGCAGAICTALWFCAFTLHAVAPVRAVGQIELLIALGISYFYFRETPTGREVIAMLLLATSIIMVLLG